jgi:hypothetical protein
MPTRLTVSLIVPSSLVSSGARDDRLRRPRVSRLAQVVPLTLR